MPYICAKTGEMVIENQGLKNAEVTVETNPKNLVSYTVVHGHSEVTGGEERWVWKEEHELTEEEAKQYYALKTKQ